MQLRVNWLNTNILSRIEMIWTQIVFGIYFWTPFCNRIIVRFSTSIGYELHIQNQ